MVTGVTSNDTTGPATTARRRKRREQLEEDDSSDLSDESDDSTVEDEDNRPANQIRFAKMPDRDRSGSSPTRRPDSRDDQGPDFIVTSPSRPPAHPAQRRGSLGAVEALKQRERRDTTTSSDISSENELDPALFRRRQVQATAAAKAGKTLAEQIKEDDEQQQRPDPETERHEIEETESISDDSSLASGFSEPGDPGMSISGSVEDLDSPEFARRSAPTGQQENQSKLPTQPAALPEELPDLPPPRPISTVQPKSALAAALKANRKKPANAFERFAALSGTGEQQPLYIKIFLPPECEAEEPLELTIRRATNAGGQVMVADTIGYALWRYVDEGMTPHVPSSKMNVNWWTLRIVEDEEVDFDFPPLSRQRPVMDFTSTNNRPPRARSTNKPWDDFALVQATEAQFAENEKVTPIYSREAEAVQQQEEAEELKPTRPEPARQPSASDPTASRTVQLRRNPVTDPMFMTAALRKDSAADAPSTGAPASRAIHRTGTAKTLNVHFTDNNFTPHVVPIPVTTDTYIAEVFDTVCRRLNIDKAMYVLKVSNTTTVAPVDRTVEALGNARQSLDLARRRFIGAGDGAFGLTGSPGSTSPNAPLLLTSASTPTKRTRRRERTGGHPLAMANVDPTLANPGAGILAGNAALNPNYKRYNVIRKQPMSFAPSHQRVLALEGEYLHVMPADTGRERLWDAGAGKTVSRHFSEIVGTKINRKHPKTFRVVVFKEGRENKRYDFEAGTKEEAREIVEEIKKGMSPYADVMGL